MPITAREYDHNGWAEIKGNPISKVGVFPYAGRSIDASLEPNKIYMVYRPAEELSSPECIDSFKLLPWVDLHPSKLLGPESVGRTPAEEKGIEGVIGQDVFFDSGDGILRANIKLFSDQLEGKIEEGIRELSVGYGCTYELSSGVYNGQHYDAIQRNIRGNHLASVPEGRMGPDVAVLDHLTFTMDAKDIQMPEMSEEEKKQKECADRAAKDGFKRYSKDAEEEEKEKKEKEAADKMAKDAEEKEKAEKEAADKKAKDEDEKKDDEKKDGMDAKISQLETELAAFKSNSVKATIREIKNRDALFNRVSHHVGVFDHSEMTTEEVAQYSVEKLGIKCAKGSEMAALDGYLLNRRVDEDEVGYAFDTAQDAAGGTSDLDKLFNAA